ncbi:hypothetical protein J2X68_007997 [Streptomyces sp. 3330]|uniref:hypothetical protein n=1 Tax=Streptomyces sp. 3330 TaxID=2817755 RepID=UPI0028545230|nr:hypothetical protein [Streptomyces sp. 3330]MDR6981255.1 hypothetical protein [Streptomyces sp. 3330]
MSDELSSALRELAAARSTAPTVGGPATRARAMRRRRRRRAAVVLGAGTAVLALLGFALTLQLGGATDHPAGGRTPAVQPSVSAPPSAATPDTVSGALDLRGRDLAFGGRVMPILSTFALPPGSGDTTPMTVVAKPARVALAVDVLSKGRTVVNVASAVELRDGNGSPLYVGAVPPDIEARGDYDVSGGVIVLGAKDAEWFHARISLGDTVAVTTATATATPTAATSSDVTPSDVTVSPGAVTAPAATTSPFPSADTKIAPPARGSAAAGEDVG